MRPVVPALLPLVVLSALAAGCAEPEPDPVVAAPGPEPVAGVVHVDEVLTSVLEACAVVVCGGSHGPSDWFAEGHAWVALDLNLTPANDDVTGPTAQVTSVRLVAECAGERRTCPAEPLASAEGGPEDFPLRLVADGFAIVGSDLLEVRMESEGPVPGEGSGARFRLAGTLWFLDPPGSGGDGGEESGDEDDG